MKKKALFLFIFNWIFSFSQDFYISDSTSLSSLFGSSHPQIETNALGEGVAIWTNTMDNSLLFCRYANGIATSPIQLNPPGLSVQSYTWSGPDLAIEGNSIYVIFKQEGYETGHIYLVKSTDNGQSFGDTVRVDALIEGYAQYPDIAVDGQNVYVTYMKHNAMGMNPQYVVSKSIDGGQTFQSTVMAGELIGNEACDCCQPELIVNGSEVIVLLRNNDANVRDIYAVISHDAAQSFTEFANIDQHNWVLNACPSTGPDARFLNSNQFLTCYKSVESNTGKVFISHVSLSDLNSFEILNLSEGVANGANYPQMLVKNDTIGIVFEGINPGTNTDVFFCFGTVNGSSLSFSPLENITQTSGIQSKPDISYFNGEFHLVYSDNSKLKFVTLSQNLSIPHSQEEKPIVSTIVHLEDADYLLSDEYEFISLTGQHVSLNKLTYGIYFITNQTTTKRIIIVP